MDIRDRPAIRLPRRYEPSSAKFVYLLRQSLCLLLEKRQILELSPSSFAILILPRLFSSWVFSFIRTFVWSCSELNVLRSRTEKRKETKRNNCTMHTPHYALSHTCWGIGLHKRCSPLPPRASKILPVTLTEVSNFHPRGRTTLKTVLIHYDNEHASVKM